MLNNIRYIKIMGILFLFLFAANSVAAATEYHLLAPLPGGTDTVPFKNGILIYGAQVFWFLLSASTVLALVMIIVGGVQYVGAGGNQSVISDAKSRITNAILGLILALASWLILYTINPKLVNLELPIEKLNIPTANPGGAIGAAIGGFDANAYCATNPNDPSCITWTSRGSTCTTNPLSPGCVPGSGGF